MPSSTDGVDTGGPPDGYGDYEIIAAMANHPQFLPGSRWQPSDRRNDHDVTNTVQVSSTAGVRSAVQRLFAEMMPAASFDALWLAFHDFDRLFEGQFPGYRGCDTVYHDKQHSLDMTLALARLLAGHQQSCPEADRFDAERVTAGIVTALFHDAGYIRRDDEPRWKNGAQFTAWHVSRSADLLRIIMPRLGLGHWTEVVTRIVHFTGYEINIDDIELDDSKDIMLGHLLGTADLMAQMADRCYLEKCRDRLYSEFVLAGIPVTTVGGEANPAAYASGIDLLKKTPGFCRNMAMQRLNVNFNRVYRYVEALYDGRNPYFEFIEQNLRYLDRIIATGNWRALRRNPPCYTVLENPIQSVTALVSRRLADLNAPASALATAPSPNA